MIKRIKAVFRRMLGARDVQNAINQSVSVSPEMRQAITDWANIYRNEPYWKKKDRRLLNLGKVIAKEFARLMLIECVITVDNSEEVNKVFSEMMKEIRPHLEKGLAKGGMVLKPYISGNGQIQIDYVDAENFFPTRYDSNGNIYGAVFISRTTFDGKCYTRIEKHEYDYKSRSERIENYAYKSASYDVLGGRTPLDSVPEWSGLTESAVIENIDAPLFAYFRVPFANTVDDESPLGVSVFEDAIGLLEDADRQYNRYLWEFEGGELAIDANTDTLITDDEDGEEFSMPENKKRLFRKFPGYTSSGAPFYNAYAPSLRDESYNTGLDTILRRIEFNVSLAYGTISNIQNVDKTAEEIRYSKERSYAIILELQKSLQNAFDKLAYAVLVLTSILGRDSLQKELQITYTWDDSIVRDPQREFTERLQMISAGISKGWEMREWYFGETEEQAKKMCPESDLPDDEE